MSFLGNNMSLISERKLFNEPESSKHLNNDFSLKNWLYFQSSFSVSKDLLNNVVRLIGKTLIILVNVFYRNCLDLQVSKLR